MSLHEQIKKFLAKRSKSAKVLQLLMQMEYVTGDDIIAIYKRENPKCEHSFTTNPQKFIEIIRRRFGADFVKSESMPFKVTLYDMNGKPYKVSDTYARYSLNLEVL